jgi:hypothetical protein
VLYQKTITKQTLSQEDRKTTGLLFIAATNIATAQQLYVGKNSEGIDLGLQNSWVAD